MTAINQERLPFSKHLRRALSWSMLKRQKKSSLRAKYPLMPSRNETRPISDQIGQICPGLNANEIQIRHDKHH